MSMRIKAALVIIAVVFVFTVANFFLSVSFTRQHLTDTMEQELYLALDIADTMISAKIDLLKSNAESIAERLEHFTTAEMQAEMAAQCEEFSDFISLTVYSKNGAFINYGYSIGHDVFSVDSEYLDFAFNGESVLTTTHSNGVSRELVMHVFAPMSENRILSATVPGLYFYNILSDYHLWNTGSIFIIDSEGTYIAGNREDLVLGQRNLIHDAKTDHNMESAGEFFETMITNDRGSGRYVYDGLERLCVYKQTMASGASGWHIGVTAPFRESPLKNLQNGLMLSMLLFLAVGVVVSIFASRIVIKPFKTIQAQSLQLTAEHVRTMLLLDAMPYACNLWDENLNLFRCNEGTTRMFGLSDKREYMENFYDFSPKYQPDGQLSTEAVAKYIRKAFDEGKCVIEWMHQKKDGTLIPTEVTLVRIVYEGNDSISSLCGPSGTILSCTVPSYTISPGNASSCVVAAYVRDLSESKKMMMDLAMRDTLLMTGNSTAEILLSTDAKTSIEASIMDSMEHVGLSLDVDRVQIWRNETVDGELHFVHTNQWLSEIGKQKTPVPIGLKFPYSQKPEWEKKFLLGECINGPLSDLPPEDQEFLNAYDMKTIVIIPLFLHEKFWGFFSIDDCKQERTFSDDEINILRSISLMMANAFSRDEMILSLRDTSTQLSEALNEAKRANEAKSGFLANMSHEMRTPLNAIIGLTDYILGTEREHDGCFAHHSYVEKVNKAGMVLLTTVNDILDISKIEAGKFELVPSDYDTASLINDVVSQSIVLKSEKLIQLVLKVNEDFPSQLYGDELRVKQVISNLLSNAIKYTIEGTVELSISCSPPADDTVWMTVTVRDTGIGIRSEDLDSIFDDYMQTDIQANRKIMGTGLGLPITKRLAELMDGSISVESEYGKGSVFTVKIPQKYIGSSAIGPETAENLRNFHYYDQKRKQNSVLARVKLPYARVLIVDDVATNLDVAKGLLRPYGMKVDCVLNGQQAIDAIRAETVRYNAIFMDHMMPGMDGIEATRQIREIGTDYAKNIPIIALTANAVKGNEEMFLSKGFQAFVSKPIELFRLDGVLRQWVRDKDQEKLLDNSIEEPKTECLCPAKKASSGITGDIYGLDVKKGLERFGNDVETYIGVLRSFTANIPSLLKKIEGVTVNDLADYAITVHGIKGSSRGIYAAAVANNAEILEKAAKNGDFLFVSSNNNEFIKSTEKLIIDLNKMLAIIDVENPKPKKDKPDESLLDRLLKACEGYDMDSVDEVIAELCLFDYTEDDGLVQWLRENAENTNFTQIVERLSGLGKPGGDTDG